MNSFSYTFVVSVRRRIDIDRDKVICSSFDFNSTFDFLSKNFFAPFQLASSLKNCLLRNRKKFFFSSLSFRMNRFERKVKLVVVVRPSLD